MEIKQLPILGSWLIHSKVHSDERGSFQEWIPNKAIQELKGKVFETAQANYSVSNKGTIRGIHYSLAPEGQVKVVTCLSGKIFDVIVDLRLDSPTFGKWHSEIIDASEPKTIYISRGLGHGFMALENNCVVAYLLSSPYQPDLEFGINPLDPEIDIKWPLSDYLMSQKDLVAPNLNKAVLV